VIGGNMIDVGLTGHPRQDYGVRDLLTPLLAQLSPQHPEFMEAAADGTVAAHFNRAALAWYVELAATTFDMEDPDLEAAASQHAKNLLRVNVRTDDIRYYRQTATSTAGWQWRRAEQDEEPASSAGADYWAGRYADSPSRESRSEMIGLVALAVADSEDVLTSSVGGELYGRLTTAAAYAFAHGVLLEVHGHQGDEDLLEQSFLFGIALRDAELAVDRLRS
jgi:hypothetical protein